MAEKKKIFAIIGSASRNSANKRLVDHFITLVKDRLDISVYENLKTLPHFDPELSADDPPAYIIAFRKEIEKAAGIIICTPEYVFSIPSGLKNAIEWCIATTVLSDKPCGLITASADGRKGHEELQLIMRTAMANFTTETTLLIQGIKGKIDDKGEMIDPKTAADLLKFANAYITLVENSTPGKDNPK